MSTSTCNESDKKDPCDKTKISLIFPLKSQLSPFSFSFLPLFFWVVLFIYIENLIHFDMNETYQNKLKTSMWSIINMLTRRQILHQNIHGQFIIMGYAIIFLHNNDYSCLFFFFLFSRGL